MVVDFTPCGDGLDPTRRADPNLPGSCPNGACTVHCECLDSPPTSAGCRGRTELPIHVSLAASQTTGAATDPVLSCVFNFAQPPSAWFRFVAPMDGVVDVATIGGNYDTVLGLFTGDCGALTQVDCNDDVSPTVYQSRLVQMVTAGTTCTVLVTNYKDDLPIARAHDRIRAAVSGGRRREQVAQHRPVRPSCLRYDPPAVLPPPTDRPRAAFRSQVHDPVRLGRCRGCVDRDDRVAAIDQPVQHRHERLGVRKCRPVVGSSRT